EEEEEEQQKAVAPVEEDRAAVHGTLRAPRHWEKLLVDAPVIGGRGRWERRLAGLHAKLTSDLKEYEKKAEDGLADHVRRDLGALEALRKFALPIVSELAPLPAFRPGAPSALWGEWLDCLAKLATRAIRHPER